MLKRLLGCCLFLSLLVPLTWLNAQEDHQHDHEHEVPEVIPDGADHHTHEMAQPPSKHAGHADEDEHGHDEHAHDNDHQDEETNQVKLSKTQQAQAGIVVQPLASSAIPEWIKAPGEIRLNSYATSRVTPRIQAQLVERHAYLGDQVVKGQPLVTLSSVAMAESQGDILAASNEWQRVRKLGSKVVSERRFQAAQIALQQARARLLAYGMTVSQLDEFLQAGLASQANGQFSLLSPQAGTVIRDSFVIGQMVEPGDLLFEITDESLLWVEARFDPQAVNHIGTGTLARVHTGQQWIPAKVIQEHHALDEATRTLAVRLEISNPGDHLHPGQFVTVQIQSDEDAGSGISLPSQALQRSPDGHWLVFVEQQPGEYKATEVEVIRQSAQRAVIAGLAPGTRVVTQGAFFLQSELAKSGFEVHNH